MNISRIFRPERPTRGTDSPLGPGSNEISR